MTDRIMPAIIAVIAAVLLAIVLFVPFVAIMYRRNGTMTFARSAGWAAFLVYALGIAAYTLLPLPESASFRCAGTQLVPFGSFADAQRYGLAGARELLTNPVIQQSVFNVALFVPLGFFLRGLMRRGIGATAIAGLVWSALIETTQWTGVWGLYRCAYRVFDVDDLIANTLGALVGAALAHLVIRPQNAPAGRWADNGSNRAGAGRRLIAMTCDFLTLALVGAVAAAAVAFTGVGGENRTVTWIAAAAWAAPAAVQLTAVLTTGRT
ncbi:MAG: VanZ family protein, partial [Bifidobacteriaceae bacterium]|nr:VanZ family protein [Bifidobacteriaceae bacterium]